MDHWLAEAAAEEDAVADAVPLRADSQTQDPASMLRGTEISAGLAKTAG
ncbi:hypothetical protein [Streptomyces sp. NPDC002533]